MLVITVTTSETWDDQQEKFVVKSTYDLELEHSLASLSKWESKYEKPFLGREDKTEEETLFYVQHCMTGSKNPPEGIFEKLSRSDYEKIFEYIDAKQTATWFKEAPPGRGSVSQQIITAEVVYSWMVELRIPFETEHWHLNKLFTLVRVCNERSKPPKKMSRQDAARQQAALNAQRQAQLNTRG